MYTVQCHSLKQTENNGKLEELFEDDANYPEPEDATHDECTAEGWADQQVSDGGPCSL